MTARRRPKWRKRGKPQRQRERPLVFRIFDLHVPVIAYVSKEDGGIETPKPIIYGTAFPIAPGLFATAGHVVRDALADGKVGLSYLSGPGEPVVHHPVDVALTVEAIDFGLMRCPSLRHLAAIPIEFDATLGLLDPVTAVGFPMAMDSEFVTCVPRGFSGTVVARRELYHLPAQPAGYELSFFAPQGLSGAPLVGLTGDRPYCYGYVIQQSTIGMGGESTPVGIAVGIDALLSVTFDGKPLAQLFGRSLVAVKRSKKHLPGGQKPPSLEELATGWPDEGGEATMKPEIARKDADEEPK